MLADTGDYQHSVQASDGGVEARSLFGVMPPTLSKCFTVLDVALGLGLRLDDLQQVRPIGRYRAGVVVRRKRAAPQRSPSLRAGRGPRFSNLRPVQGPVVKVDDVAMVLVGGAGAHLLAANIGKDHFAVTRVLSDQPPHFGER